MNNFSEDEDNYDFDAASVIFERMERSLSLRNSFNRTFLSFESEDNENDNTYYDPDQSSLYDIDLKGTKALLITANRDKHRALRKVQRLQDHILELRKENSILEEHNKRLNLIHRHSNVWKLPGKVYQISQKFCSNSVSKLFQRWKTIVLNDFRAMTALRKRANVLSIARKNVLKLHLISQERALQKWKSQVRLVDSSLTWFSSLTVKRLEYRHKRNVMNVMKSAQKKKIILRRLKRTMQQYIVSLYFQRLKKLTTFKTNQLKDRRLSVHHSLALLYKSHKRIDSVRSAFYIWLAASDKESRLTSKLKSKRQTLNKVVGAFQHREVRNCFKQWYRVITTNHYRCKIVSKILKSIGENRNYTRLRSAFKFWSSKSAAFDGKCDLLRQTIVKWHKRGVRHYFHRWSKRVHHDHLRGLQAKHLTEQLKMKCCQSLMVRLKYVLLMKVYFKLWFQHSQCSGVIHSLQKEVAESNDVNRALTNNLGEKSGKLVAMIDKYDRTYHDKELLIQQHKERTFCNCILRMWKGALYRAFVHWKHRSESITKSSNHRDSSSALKRKYTVRLVFSWLKNATGGKLVSAFKRWQITSRKMSALLVIRQNVVHVHIRHLLHQWQNKYKKRMKLKGMINRLIKCVSVHSLAEAFQLWKKRNNQQHSTEDLFTQVFKCRRKFLLRHALTRWNKNLNSTQYSLAVETKSRTENTLRETRLFSYVCRWKQYIVRLRLRLLNIKVFVTLKHRDRMRLSWNKWKIKTKLSGRQNTCSGILNRVSKHLTKNALRSALSRWKSFNWYVTSQHQLSLTMRLNQTLGTIHSLTAQQDQLERHNHQGMTAAHAIENRNARFFTQVIRLLVHSRSQNLLSKCHKMWIAFHLDRRLAKLTVVKYTQKMLFHGRLCSLSHGFHHWINVIKSSMYANDWSLIMKKRELLQTMRLHMTQWKSFNQERKLLAKSFRAHMYHVQRFSTVRSIYYAFYKWKAHHIVEHNYWISVTSRLFNRWANATKTARDHRRHLTEFCVNLGRNQLNDVFQRWRVAYLRTTKHRRVSQVIIRSAKRILLHYTNLQTNKAFQKWREVISSYHKTVCTWRTVVKCGQRTAKKALLKWKNVVLFQSRQVGALKFVLTRRNSLSLNSKISFSFYNWKQSTKTANQCGQRDNLLTEVLAKETARLGQRRAWCAWKRAAQLKHCSLHTTGPQLRLKLEQVHAYIVSLYTSQHKYLSPEAAIAVAVEGFKSILPAHCNVTVFYRLQNFPPPNMTIPPTPSSRMTDDWPAEEDILWGLSSSSFTVQHSSTSSQSLKKYNSSASVLSGIPLSRANSIRGTSPFANNGISPIKSVRISEQATIATPYQSFRTTGSVFSLKDLQSPPAPATLKIDTNSDGYPMTSGLSTLDTMRSGVAQTPSLVGGFSDSLRYSDTRHLEVAVGEGLVGECALTGRTKVVRVDVFDEVKAVSDSVVTEMVVPLHSGSCVVGVLHIQCPLSNQTLFSPDSSALKGGRGNSASATPVQSRSPHKPVFTFEDDVHRSSQQVLLACLDLKLDEITAACMLSYCNHLATVFSAYFYRESQVANPSDLVGLLIHHDISADVDELTSAAAVGVYEYLRYAISHGVGQKSTASESGQEMNKLREQIHKLKLSRSKHITLAKELQSSLEDVKSKLVVEQEERSRVVIQLKKSEDRLGKYVKHQQDVQLLNQEMKSVAAKTFA